MPALRRSDSRGVRPVDGCVALCWRALSSGRLRAAASALERDHNHGTANVLLQVVEERPATHREVNEWVESIPLQGFDRNDLIRALIVRAALNSLEELRGAALPDEVITRFCDEFAFLATPGSESDRQFEIGSSRFTRACKLVTLRRFPAGQFEWERSGISRGDLLHASRRHPITTLAALWRMRGLSPVFFSHLNPRRPDRSLSERESNRSYYLMAMAMERQPEVRGFAACSWFRAPSTHAVSPHLAWLSRVFLENGGLVVDSGRADPDCGVFHRSTTRRRLYEADRFTPRLGLVLWPRQAMIAWAHAHPELAA
jgi:hypothetical protein